MSREVMKRYLGREDGVGRRIIGLAVNSAATFFLFEGDDERFEEPKHHLPDGRQVAGVLHAYKKDGQW